MRVSTDPNDPAYIDDRPRRVWCNDVEITGWTVADEFRRVVIVDGKPRFGSIRIERLQSGEGGNPVEATPTIPVHAGFSGVFVHTPDPKPETPALVPAMAEGQDRKITPPAIVASPAVPAMSARHDFRPGKSKRR